jgi:cyclic pyranopterin phosphate synthase
MPKEIYGRGYQFLAKDQLLTFEELGRLARVFASLGTRKVRLTGGEPLMRRGLEILVADLARSPRTARSSPIARKRSATQAWTASPSASTRSTTRSSSA